MSKNSIIDNREDYTWHPSFLCSLERARLFKHKSIALTFKPFYKLMTLTIEEIEELEELDKKYVVGDKSIENLAIALRIKELTDKCDNTER